MMENGQRQFRLFEQRLAEKLDQSAGETKRQESALMTEVENKFATLSTELGKESGEREEELEGIKASLEVDCSEITSCDIERHTEAARGGEGDGRGEDRIR